MKKTTSLGELIANAVSHGFGVLLSITALVLLLVKSNTLEETLATLIFSISLILLYLSSTLFHSFPEKMETVVSVFQRFDHSGIFLLITGTYTPFLILALGTKSAYILLGVLWTLTLIGVILKSIWIQKYKYVHLAMYLIMGWSIVFIFNDMKAIMGNELLFLIIGGLSYTIGVVFYVSKFKYQHFIWHLFVLTGSIFHFLCIYLYLL
ncbi:MAG: hemolysin III family protein [Candidatus Izemoplasma sp.]